MQFSRNLLLASSILFGACTAPALADAPAVAVSIKPIHSLVSAVMEGVGEPALIVRATGSEHAYALRPSDAEALQSARIVFWIGPGMESFLEKSLASLASDAIVVAVSETPGLALREFREGGPFESHEHGERASHDAEHEHSDDDDHAPDEHDAEAEKAQGGHHDHEHGDGHQHDMHVWLDPDNAKAIVASVAETLTSADTENASRYVANAAAYTKRLDELSLQVEAELAPVRGRPYVVFHDAYQYFEERFDIPAAGSITVSPEVTPGVQRVAEIKAKVAALGATCVFSEPQFEPRLVGVVAEGTQARTGVLDPLGAEIADGPDLYPTLIRNLASSLRACLSDPS